MKKILLVITVLLLFNLFTAGETMKKTDKPLRFFWLDEMHTKPGKIGITTLPGRKDKNRTIEGDIATLKKEHITHVVTLVPKKDLMDYGVPHLMETMQKEGLVTYHLPIEDYGVCTIPEMKELVQWLKARKNEGKRIVIHCVGGLGRSGMAAAAYLIENNKMTAKQAIMEVRRKRSPHAVETKEQEEFLKSFAQ